MALGRWWRCRHICHPLGVVLSVVWQHDWQCAHMSRGPGHGHRRTLSGGHPAPTAGALGPHTCVVQGCGCSGQGTLPPGPLAAAVLGHCMAYLLHGRRSCHGGRPALSHSSCSCTWKGGRAALGGVGPCSSRASKKAAFIFLNLAQHCTAVRAQPALDRRLATPLKISMVGRLELLISRSALPVARSSCSRRAISPSCQ